MRANRFVSDRPNKTVQVWPVAEEQTADQTIETDAIFAVIEARIQSICELCRRISNM